MKIETHTDHILIDGKKYVEQGSQASAPSVDLNGMNYVVIRSRDSGCHAGYLKEEEDAHVRLVNSRRLYYWDGAATLSQLAMEGVKNPGNCKFPGEVDNIKIMNYCEIINTTSKAQESIQGVQIWKK